MPEALATHYEIEEGAGSLFEVHRPLDEEHAPVVRELMMAQSGGEADDQALEGADRAARALWRFLDHLV